MTIETINVSDMRVNSLLEERFEKFVCEMRIRFLENEAKHGDNSITIEGKTVDNVSTFENIYAHLMEELNELYHAIEDGSLDDAIQEGYDVANMLLLVNWYNEVKKAEEREKQYNAMTEEEFERKKAELRVKEQSLNNREDEIQKMRKEVRFMKERIRILENGDK